MTTGLLSGMLIHMTNTTTTTTAAEATATVALSCWQAGQMTWTQLEEALASLGVSNARAAELSAALNGR